MGVQGLSSLVDNKDKVLRDHKLYHSKLVIDGSNLIHLLYGNSGLDQNHGGEYAEFAEILKRFVAALRDCEISPYVLMDGRSSDRKSETSIQRAKDRIKRANEAAKMGTMEGILPPLARSVFIQTMAQLKVPLAQCYREADPQIVALARNREWECPVLSDDSDFYIFQLPEGMLPIKHFQWEAVNKSDAKKYVPCKIYNTVSFCREFNLHPELLPAFAVLGGNDYVKLWEIDWSQFDRSGNRGTTVGERRLNGLLSWLKEFNRPHEDLEEALKLVKQSNDDLRSKVTTAMEEYQPPASVFKKFFLHGEAPQLPSPEKDLVPDWMRLPLTQEKLCSQVLDVLVVQRMNLTFVVELAELPSSSLTSRPIRQLMYGLLLGGESNLKVKESGREGLEMNTLLVTPRITSTTRKLPLASLHEADLSVRLQFLLEALGVTEASLSKLPSKERLPVAVTCYWLQNAQPTPNRSQLGALMQGMMSEEHGEAASLTNTPDVDSALAFNQWQICLRDAMDLNQLLNFPLPEPDIACLFQGTLVHHLLNSTDVQAYPLPAVLRSVLYGEDTVQDKAAQQQVPENR